ncbi:MAG: glucose-1-phosphate thymidylyltransferase [Candidatus Aenigmarchaeota archaeon]|nr:glucose-1-phosphate thymidylyltransferase [Candidatus Aenigmarchaeota archaeon]
MKGLILAGGLGKRLRPLTHTGPKQLIPIANKPVLHYIVEDIAEAGIVDIGVVVGYTAERINSIKESLGDGSKWGVRITYIEQDAPRGLAHAVWISKGFIGNDDFVVYLGDNILKEGIVRFVEEFEKGRADVSLLISKHQHPEKFGIVEINGDEVIGVEEKPVNPKSDYVITGVYIFQNSVFGYIDGLKPSGRGELELTHVVQKVIESKKHSVVCHKVSGWWDDAGTADDVLRANHVILSDTARNIMGRIETGAVVTGNVELGKNSTIKSGAVVRGPVIIGENCVIGEGAYIGPYTSIGDNTIIENGEIDSCIIMGDSKINLGGKKMVDSLMGRRVTVSCRHSIPKGYKFIVGEDSEISV